MILKYIRLKTSRKILTILLLIIFSGFLMTCQDESAVNDAGELETCKLYLDKSEWDLAVAACKDLETDEGRHMSALAYMGRSGLTMAALMVELSDSSGSATKLVYSKIPDTDAKKSDFKKALYKIMGEITNKTPTMYFEGVLLSSLLVFKELQTLFTLKFVDETFQTCAGTVDNLDITKCSFASTTTSAPYKFIFNGLGSEFYKGICGSIEGDTADDANIETSTDTFFNAFDVTVDSCTVSNKSALYYNKLASDEYEESGTLDLSLLNFYTKMDMGGNFSVTFNTVSIQFCNDGQIALPVKMDDKLSDCEILNYLENSGLK